MELIKPKLNGAEGTALLALYARALDYRSSTPILRDEGAEEVVEKLDYDWRKFRTAKNQKFNVGIRTRQMDEWTAAFVAKQPSAVVLDLGCGLDRRFFRVQPPPTVDWYDIDSPNIIELRHAFYHAGENYHTVAASLPERDWLEALPSDRPAMVVADGVFPFLRDEEVQDLVIRLVEHFPSGQLVFNQYSKLMATMARHHPAVRSTGASLNHGFNDPRLLEQWHPRLRMVEEASLVGSPHIAQLPRSVRATCRAMASVQMFRRYGQMVRYKF